MTIDLTAWRRVLEEVVDAISDEDLQRRAWFGIGPEESSPDEDICQFFGDAAIEEFLDRDDTGLNAAQIDAGRRLVAMMRELSDKTDRATGHIKPSELIDDPRWQEIRRAAADFRKLLRA
jgi:hypothetical protein